MMNEEEEVEGCAAVGCIVLILVFIAVLVLICSIAIMGWAWRLFS